jgi:dipeptidyl aminopeptidase/acylaminoacyl peptidase
VPLRVGRNLDLARINAYDGTWTSIAKGAEHTMAWFVDRTGEPVIRFDTNRRRTELRVLTPEARKSGQVRWKEALKIRLDKETERSDEFSPIAPGPSPELYYVLARPNGADRAGIHLYNIETQAYAQEVFTHPRVDVDAGITDPLTGAYVGASYWNDKLEMTFSDKKMQAHYNGLDTFFGKERNISFVDVSSDGNIWVLATSGPRDPGTFHVYDMANANNQPVGFVNPRLRESQLAKVQTIAYKARDGLDISGYLTLPPSASSSPGPDAKPPLIVYVHGGPEARDTQKFDTTVQFLATRGYAVFQPNFRGSSGYGKAFVQAGRRQFGKAMQTDVLDGVQQVLGMGAVDAQRVCIMGESYGGYAALMGLVQSPEIYKCAVATAGPTDLHRQVKWERAEEGWDSESYKYWVEQIGDPWRDEAAMKAISPINNIAAIKAPVLLAHGRRDDTVPFEQSDLMYKALQKAGKTSSIVEFVEGGHNFSQSDYEIYLKEVETFFGKHLAPAAAAPAN